ncbi:glycosyltransferase family 1 protein [Bacillus cereus]|uniref:glycosyltransferase family 1 protein n=1 Tax=Bacillus cereus TaxID=1396 RepID=UPI003815C148
MASSRAKRILHITGGMNRGGAETMIMNLYRKINKEEIQFDFVYFRKDACDYDDEIKQLGGNIYYICPPKISNPLKFIVELKRTISLNGPYYAVHAHTLYNIGLSLFASKLAGVNNRIAHAHSTQDMSAGSKTRVLYKGIMRFLINTNANYRVACGMQAGEFLFGSTFKNDGIIIPNAIDLDMHMQENNENIRELHSELAIDKNTLVIGQIGSLKDVKNYRFSIKLASALKKKGKKFHMLFVGDGELRDELEDLVVKEELGEYISFLGVREDIPNLMKIFDVLIMPSLFEGLPLTIIEAQASGIPCVISNTITKEADLGLGLVQFVDLESGLENWIEIICASPSYRELNKKLIETTLQKKGYDILTGVEKLKRLYGL